MLEKRCTRPEQIAANLRREILSGRYPANSYMPPERQLARDFGAALRTVSQAMNTLSAQGLVEQTRGRGTRVLDPLERLEKPRIAVVHRLHQDIAITETGFMMQGIREALGRRGYRYDVVSVVLRGESYPGQTPSLPSPDALRSLPDQYGAAVFAEVVTVPEIISELAENGFPLAVANLEVDVKVDGTFVDHPKFVRQAAQLLAAMGHRRIALVCGNPRHYFYGRAVAAYRRALAELAMGPDDALICTSEFTSALNAYLDSRHLWRMEAPPTAVITGRDVIAEGVCQAITESGRTVGRDVSVIGFDDISWQAGRQFLTTFREPCYELGAQAVALLADRLIAPATPSRRVELEAPLIMRTSVAPVVGEGPLPPPAQTGVTLAFPPGSGKSND